MSLTLKEKNRWEKGHPVYTGWTCVNDILEKSGETILHKTDLIELQGFAVNTGIAYYLLNNPKTGVKRVLLEMWQSGGDDCVFSLSQNPTKIGYIQAFLHLHLHKSVAKNAYPEFKKKQDSLKIL
jgi:hypothetical protein